MYADPEVMRYVGRRRTLTKADTELSVRRMIERWDDDGFGPHHAPQGRRVRDRAGRDPDLEQRDLGADDTRAGIRPDGGRGRLHARPRLTGAGVRDQAAGAVRDTR